MYSVRHYDDNGTQKKDEKYNKSIDPTTGGPVAPNNLDPHPGGGKQGVFYPRSSGIGGCTAHHAMITIRPNDKDWNYIAELTGDPSWRAGAMRGYFAKLERNQYLKAYHRFLGKLLASFMRSSAGWCCCSTHAPCSMRADTGSKAGRRRTSSTLFLSPRSPGGIVRSFASS